MNDISVTTMSYLSDNIALILQESRACLKLNNQNYCIENQDSHRIVLLCILHFALFSNEYVHKYEIPMTLGKLIDGFKDCKWVYDFYPKANQYVNVEIFDCYNKVTEIKSIKEWKNLLPYALETFEYSPERFLESTLKRGVHRIGIEKKNFGIYYTPKDVISHMVEKCLQNLYRFNNSEKSFLDCSCGTGVFLTCIIDYVRQYTEDISNVKEFLSFINNSIWGIDISSIAIINSKFLFMMYAYINFSPKEDTANALWNLLDKHFVCGDATELNKILEEHPSMPRKFDCIIGNPPYVTKGKHDNLFIKFVENIITFSKEDSCSSMIVPLSICYSRGKSFISLRQAIINDESASWLFENFDRSPDSLFGDHVKTRNTILFRMRAGSQRTILSSGIVRWTSENRNKLFNNIKTTNIIDLMQPNGIPKLQNEIEVDAYKKLQSGGSPFSSLFEQNICDKKNFISINGTAYNWICAYDHIPQSVDANGSPYKPVNLSLYNLPSEDDVYFCVSVLNNRITYWYWNVIGDAFHVNAALYDRLYLGRDSFSHKGYLRMVALGREYCSKIISYPTYSVNAGKKIVNYDYKQMFSVVNAIEKEIISAKNILPEFAEHIISWYDDHVSCGRNQTGGKY